MSVIDITPTHEILLAGGVLKEISWGLMGLIHGLILLFILNVSSTR
jgi:hypothetical protein